MELNKIFNQEVLNKFINKGWTVSKKDESFQDMATPKKLNFDNPCIYVANLGAYNSGRLIGEWLDLTIFNTVETLEKEIDRIANINPMLHGDEWAIHDYNNMPSSLGENPDLEKVLEVAALIKDNGFEAVKGFIDNWSIEDLEYFEESFCGSHESFKAYAEQYFDDCMEVPEHLANYIDYDSFARDLAFDYSEAPAPDCETFIYRSF